MEFKNPFKNIGGGKLFGTKTKGFLGIDIGASSIKVVQLNKKKGVAVLETYGELSLGPYAKTEVGRATNLSAQEIAEALKNLLEESNVSATECGISIPLRSSLVFTMQVPAVNQKQLAQIIPIEARKYIPVPISEVSLDWKVIPKESPTISSFVGEEAEGEITKNKMENLDILVVAIHNDTITRQNEIVKNLNLDLSFLEIEIFSTIRASSGQNVMNFAILDMGSGATKLYLVEKGVVRDSHIIGRGSQDITLNISRSTNISVEEAEKLKVKIGVEAMSEEEKKVSEVVSSNLEFIFSEVNKVILNYQKKYNRNIDKLVIAGGGAIVRGILPFAKSHVEVDVEIIDPFSKVESPAFLDDLLKQVGPGFGVALGVALRGLKQQD